MDVTRRRLLAGVCVASLGVLAVDACTRPAKASPDDAFEVTHSDAEWRQLLTPEQYDVLRRAGTEVPYSSPLNDEHGQGVFACAGCALDLFSSDTKFDSGTGWPSFWQPLAGAVIEQSDETLFMSRTEVLCRRCGGHLGHVFDDGPQPTGLRYCMNGVAMTFRAT
jgi:peptide-methionine (R)-S-oxide reductase